MNYIDLLMNYTTNTFSHTLNFNVDYPVAQIRTGHIYHMTIDSYYSSHIMINIPNASVYRTPASIAIKIASSYNNMDRIFTTLVITLSPTGTVTFIRDITNH